MIKFQIHCSQWQHFCEFECLYVFKSLPKPLHLSVVGLKFEFHMLLGMCFTVMIPAVHTRCLSRSPGSISEPSITWYLKCICKDFGTYLSVLIPTSNSCCILTQDKISQSGYEYHYTIPCCAISSWTNTGVFPWMFWYFTNKNTLQASVLVSLML